MLTSSHVACFNSNYLLKLQSLSWNFYYSSLRLRPYTTSFLLTKEALRPPHGGETRATFERRIKSLDHAQNFLNMTPRVRLELMGLKPQDITDADDGTVPYPYSPVDSPLVDTGDHSPVYIPSTSPYSAYLASENNRTALDAVKNAEDQTPPSEDLKTSMELDCNPCADVDLDTLPLPSPLPPR